MWVMKSAPSRSSPGGEVEDSGGSWLQCELKTLFEGLHLGAGRSSVVGQPLPNGPLHFLLTGLSDFCYFSICLSVFSFVV
jgi:hypothetical protein